MADERTNEAEIVTDDTKEEAAVPVTGENDAAAMMSSVSDNAGSGGMENGSGQDNCRMDRDAGAMARQRLQAADETNGEALTEQSLSRKEQRQKEKEERERTKREAKEAGERQKREAQEAKANAKREEREAKERRKRLAEEERQKRLYEKKEAKAVIRQERRQEWKSLWHMAEFAMLVTFIVLAIDQAGLYGFLFVWLFVAVMIASIALLLLGIVRAIRKKRCGIIFCVAVLGLIACTAWFIFLVSSQGLGLGPVPN